MVIIDLVYDHDGPDYSIHLACNSRIFSVDNMSDLIEKIDQNEHFEHSIDISRQQGYKLCALRGVILKKRRDEAIYV